MFCYITVSLGEFHEFKTLLVSIYFGHFDTYDFNFLLLNGTGLLQVRENREYLGKSNNLKIEANIKKIKEFEYFLVMSGNVRDFLSYQYESK